jgi:hypothetical protein
VPLDLNARHAPWLSALAEEANHAVLGNLRSDGLIEPFELVVAGGARD